MAGSLRERTLCEGLPRRGRELVVVSDFDFVCMAILPAKTNTILFVDPNTMLTYAVTSEPLKPIARRNSQLREVAHSIELVKLATRSLPQRFRACPACRPRLSAVKDVLSPSIGERAYHGADCNGLPVSLTSHRQCHCPKQYSLPSSDPITTRAEAIAGEADSGAPALNSQTFAPVL